MKMIFYVLILCTIIPAVSHAISKQKPSFYDRAMAALSTPQLPPSRPASPAVLIYTPSFTADYYEAHNDDPLHRRPRTWYDRAQQTRPKNVGLGLIIGGGACLALGGYLVAYGNNYHNPKNNGDETGLFAFLMGLLLGAGGLGMLIPGIVLKSKGK